VRIFHGENEEKKKERKKEKRERIIVFIRVVHSSSVRGVNGA
jgi:hypothetical protein